MVIKTKKPELKVKAAQFANPQKKQRVLSDTLLFSPPANLFPPTTQWYY